MSVNTTTQRQIKTATVHAGAVVLPESILLSDPLHNWRGFFVGYSFYIGFYGYRQTPARAGATILPG
ncbi:MAG: hypothetical protein R6W76_17440 [Caldilinea sp.]